MMKSSLPRKPYIDFLVAHRIKHTVEYTNRTWVVKSKIGDEMFTNSNITLRGLGLMQKVGAYVRRHIDELEKYKRPYKIDRMYFREMPVGKEIRKVREIDLTRAYWVAARKLDIISEDIFKQAYKYPYNKIEILASLGSMARKKMSRSFDGKKYSKSVEIRTRAKTAHLWDAISFEVDQVMQACALVLGEDFYFYWTDAVFFHDTKANAKKLERVIKKLGYNFKTNPVEYIEQQVVDNHKVVWAWTKENKGHAKKPVLDKDGNYGRIFIQRNILLDIFD